MYETMGSINVAAGNAGNRAYASDMQTISASRLAATTERVRTCCAIATNATMGLNAELDRLLGAAPTASEGADRADPANPGALGELDDLVSVLMNALERINNQTNRLSQV